MAHDREVAGIRCTEVLADLSDYLDGSLSPERRARIDAHLRGCDWCTHFGGAFAATVNALRDRLRTAEPPEAGVRERLHRRLGIA